MPSRQRHQHHVNGIWSEEEHDRFLDAVRKFPRGPWDAIAQAVGTRSVRQVQTHTQKYYEKIMRRVRGLHRNRKTWARVEHRIDDDILEFCRLMRRASDRSPPKAKPLFIAPKQIDARSWTTVSDRAAFTLSEKHEAALTQRSRSIDDIGAIDAPPFEEALDFLIDTMLVD